MGVVIVYLGFVQKQLYTTTLHLEVYGSKKSILSRTVFKSLFEILGVLKTQLLNEHTIVFIFNLRI